MITLISPNYPCLKHFFMVPNVFEPLKFYCIFHSLSEQSFVNVVYFVPNEINDFFIRKKLRYSIYINFSVQLSMDYKKIKYIYFKLCED